MSPRSLVRVLRGGSGCRNWVSHVSEGQLLITQCCFGNIHVTCSSHDQVSADVRHADLGWSADLG